MGGKPWTSRGCINCRKRRIKVGVHFLTQSLLSTNDHGSVMKRSPNVENVKGKD